MHGGARGTNGLSCGKEEKDFWEVTTNYSRLCKLHSSD